MKGSVFKQRKIDPALINLAENYAYTFDIRDVIRRFVSFSGPKR